MKTKTKIIIIEDDVFFGNLIKNFLVNQEYENVILFTDEEECLKSIKTEQALYILDHHLVKMTGLEVMNKIKEKNAKAQFIYLSGESLGKVAVKALRNGALDYIEKNKKAFVKLNDLIEQVLLHNLKQADFNSFKIA